MTDNIKIFDLDKTGADLNPKAVSLGNFDGIHRGHQKLMKKNVEISKQYGLMPSVLLFKENTKNLLKGEKKYLTSLADKIEILKKLGIECFCLLEFSEEFKNLSPEKFIEEILYKKLNTKFVIVGNNYYFGKDAKADKNTLIENEKNYGYKTCVVDFEMDGDKIINSTDIRNMIRDGEIKKANYDLARPYRIAGKVVGGEKRGRLLHFPTANLKESFNYVIPKNGVYFTQVHLDDEKFFGLTNIGTNPTFGDKHIKIETNILDFDRDIYGKDISIDFLDYLRGDFKFESREALIEQMNKDKKKAYELKDKYLQK